CRRPAAQPHGCGERHGGFPRALRRRFQPQPIDTGDAARSPAQGDAVTGDAGRALAGAAAALLVAGAVGLAGGWFAPASTAAALAIFALIAIVIRLGLVDHASPQHRGLAFGFANRLTLARAVIACLILATIGAALGEAARWVIAAAAGLAI